MKKWLPALSVASVLVVAPIVLGWWDLTIGGWILGRKAVQRDWDRGYRKSRIVIGGAVIQPGVDGRMLTEVVPSLTVIGGLVCPKGVREAYGKNLKVIGGLGLRDDHPESQPPSV